MWYPGIDVFDESTSIADAIEDQSGSELSYQFRYEAEQAPNV